MADIFDSISLDKAKSLLDSGVSQAQSLMRDPSKINDLLLQIELKLKEVPVIGETLSDVPVMISMIKCYITGEYTEVSPKVIALMVSSLIYLIKKKDLISDGTPVIGIADDIGVMASALKLCNAELEAFKRWRDGEQVSRAGAGFDAGDTTNMQRAAQFLKDAGSYYLATVEGDQPRVRPFGTVNIFENKMYIQTGKLKAVSKQLHANPKAEICAFKNGEWIRITGQLIEDNRIEAKQSLLDAYPDLQKVYSAEDENTEVFYFTNAAATISSFTKEPETFEL